MASLGPYAEVEIGVGAHVEATAVLGCRKEARIRDDLRGNVTVARPVRVGERCLVLNSAILYEGVEIGADSVVEDQVRVGYDGRVGPRSRLTYRAYVCDRVTVGSDCRIAGFVCDSTTIGDRCSVLGQLGHEYSRPHRGWWEVDEPAPRIEDDSVVGLGAQVIGDVRVGPRSYVAAGAVVTRDVPPEHIVVGVNGLVPAARWPGGRLQELIAYWARSDG